MSWGECERKFNNCKFLNIKSLKLILHDLDSRKEWIIQEAPPGFIIIIFITCAKNACLIVKDGDKKHKTS